MIVTCKHYCPEKKFVHSHDVEYHRIKVLCTSVSKSIHLGDIGDVDLYNVYMIDENGKLEQEKDVSMIEVI